MTAAEIVVALECLRTANPELLERVQGCIEDNIRDAQQDIDAAIEEESEDDCSEFEDIIAFWTAVRDELIPQS